MDFECPIQQLWSTRHKAAHARIRQLSGFSREMPTMRSLVNVGTEFPRMPSGRLVDSVLGESNKVSGAPEGSR